MKKQILIFTILLALFLAGPQTIQAKTKRSGKAKATQTTKKATPQKASTPTKANAANTRKELQKAGFIPCERGANGGYLRSPSWESGAKKIPEKAAKIYESIVKNSSDSRWKDCHYAAGLASFWDAYPRHKQSFTPAQKGVVIDTIFDVLTKMTGVLNGSSFPDKGYEDLFWFLANIRTSLCQEKGGCHGDRGISMESKEDGKHLVMTSSNGSSKGKGTGTKEKEDVVKKKVADQVNGGNGGGKGGNKGGGQGGGGNGGGPGGVAGGSPYGVAGGTILIEDEDVLYYDPDLVYEDDISHSTEIQISRA